MPVLGRERSEESAKGGGKLREAPRTEAPRTGVATLSENAPRTGVAAGASSEDRHRNEFRKNAPRTGIAAGASSEDRHRNEFRKNAPRTGIAAGVKKSTRYDACPRKGERTGSEDRRCSGVGKNDSLQCLSSEGDFAMPVLGRGLGRGLGVRWLFFGGVCLCGFGDRW